jgi:hypothetical protein
MGWGWRSIPIPRYEKEGCAGHEDRTRRRAEASPQPASNLSRKLQTNFI